MGTDKSRAILVIFAGYFVYFYNKKSVTNLFTFLIDDYKLSQQNAGYISSCQHFSISLVTFLGGILTDYISPLVLFPFGLVLCAVTTFVFPFGTTTGYFAFVWFLNGIGHGLTMPSAIRITKLLSGDGTFATNWSFVVIANNLAGVLNPLVHTTLANIFGWKFSMFLCSAITATVGVTIFTKFSRLSITKPETSKSSQAKSSTSKSKQSSVLTPILFLVAFNRFIIAFDRLSVADWTSIYFTTEKQLSPIYGSIYVTIFELASVAGKLLSGRINDYVVKRFLGRRSTIRLPLTLLFYSLNMLAMLLYTNLINSSSSLAVIVLVALINGGSSAANLFTLTIMSTEIGQQHNEGLTLSICSLAAKVGSLFSAYPFTLLVLWLDWNLAFGVLIMGQILVASTNGFLLLTRSSKLKIN